MIQEAEDEAGGWVSWHCNGEIMVLEGRSLTGRDAHFLIGQDDFGGGRKLLCNQKSDLILSQVEPVLVSRLGEGSRTPEPAL